MAHQDIYKEQMGYDLDAQWIQMGVTGFPLTMSKRSKG